MAAYRTLAVLFVTMLACAVEANLDLGKIWSGLSTSNTVKTETVQKQALEEMSKLQPPFLLRGAPMVMQMPKTDKKSLRGPFAWSSCGPPSQSIEIRNLTLGPSPFHFPGELDFGFDIMFHDTLGSTSTLSADLEIQINTQGTWIKLPCIANLGSCHYDDLCSILKRIQCPPDLTEQNIPCNCPFSKGEYKLTKYSVTIDASVFPIGDYRAKAVLTDSVKGQVGCYSISFTME